MSLVYGPSAICFSDISKETYFVGVGPYLRVFQNDVLIAEHSIFPITSRIKGIVSQEDRIITYASNFIKVIIFNSDFSSFKVIKDEQFDDYVLLAKYVDDEVLIVILHHGQICTINDQIIIQNPKTWKIVTSAFIISKDIFIFGDSFGNINYLDRKENIEINKSSDFGTVFCIDFDEETKAILTANEFRTCAMFSLCKDDKKIKNVWAVNDHPSRVWGCKLLPIGPISYGEDGCIHLHSKDKDQSKSKAKIFHLHRTKNITAFASNGNEVITAGQNAVLRHLTLYDNIPDPVTFNFGDNENKKAKLPMTPFSLAIMQSGEVIVGTFGGKVISLPSQKEISNDEKCNTWYLMQSFENVVFGASRSHHHLLYNNGNVMIFEYPQNCSAISLAVGSMYVAAVYSDNQLKIYDFEGNEKISISISEYIKKPPIALSIHSTKPIVGFGSHSSRVVVLEFENNFISFIKAFTFQSASSDGFRGIVFGGDELYCAGRTDGTVSIIGKCDDNWQLKSSWRIAAQCKSTVGIDVICDCENNNNYSRPIVSVSTKEGIAIWDIGTQTMIAQHPLVGQNDKLTIKFLNNRSYAVSWVDPSKVYVQSNVPSIPAFSIGTSFHGLRGLCSTRFGDIVATGSCDRDVKLWRIVGDNGKIICVDSLQAVDSGTHAICTYEKESLIFAGGSKEFLYVWKVQNDKLFRLNIFKVGDNLKIYQLRVTSMAINDDKRLFIGMSDASVRIFDYINNELKFVEKIQLKGVPVSCVNTDGIISVVTTTGDSYWLGKKSIEKRLQNCGLHCIRSFLLNDGQLCSVTSGDDGDVKIWKVDDNPQNIVEMLSIHGGHAGGTKALAIDVAGSVLRLLSFSYDQKLILYYINLASFEITKSFDFPVTVTDGEACEFVKNGFIVFGFAIQFIPFDINKEA